MTASSSFIFRTVARLLFFLVNVFALYLLLRGHNQPGGGFIAGLATSTSFILLKLAVGLQEIHRLIRFEPLRLATVGLLLATLTGTVPVLCGHAFLEHFDTYLNAGPLFGKLHLGTPLLFDFGVYLVVVGIASKIIFVLGKSTQGFRALVAEEEARYSSPVEQPIEAGWAEPAAQDQGGEGRHAN